MSGAVSAEMNTDIQAAFADTATVMALSTGYWNSQVLLTANRIGLFANIADKTLSLEQLAAACATQPRPTRLLLKALVSLGLLLETDAGYRNTPVTKSMLVPGGSAFLGNTIKYSDDLYQTWGKLENALRDDQPQLPAVEYLGKDSARTRNFVYGMHDRALGVGNTLASLVDLTGRSQLLDVGGGPGTYSSLFARRFPGLKAQVLDLPDIVAIASEIIGDMGVKDQVTVVPGDYYTTEFPQDNDVVLISGVFHRETETMCRELIERARHSLRPGGLLIISDVFTDAGGTSPPMATLFGLNMMLTAPNGGVHADADVRNWMIEAGFTDTGMQAFPPPMPHRVVTGIKA